VRRLINLHQTKDERKKKYWLARSIGLNSYRASQVRDWRMSTIERYFADRLKVVVAPESGANNLED